MSISSSNDSFPMKIVDDLSSRYNHLIDFPSQIVQSIVSLARTILFGLGAAIFFGQSKTLNKSFLQNGVNFLACTGNSFLSFWGVFLPKTFEDSKNSLTEWSVKQIALIEVDYVRQSLGTNSLFEFFE